MPNDNFRRELGHAFDEMAGSPSDVFPDRVRSSLSAAPEHRGPFWIAGIAAALIAVLVVGILVVANLNRHQTSIAPAGPPTPAADASPSPSAVSATPETNLPPFVCASSDPMTSSNAPPVVPISALRTGTHPGYDRLTVEFTNGQPGSIELRTQSGTLFTNSPRGNQVTLAGNNGIFVVIHGADLHSSYTGPTDVKPNYAALVEVRLLEDFEGVVQLGLGINGASCYRAFILTNPTRLVIDVRAA